MTNNAFSTTHESLSSVIVSYREKVRAIQYEMMHTKTPERLERLAEQIDELRSEAVKKAHGIVDGAEGLEQSDRNFLVSEARHFDEETANDSRTYSGIDPVLTKDEKKCATALARAFYYLVPDFQPMLPTYREVLNQAKKVIHEEVQRRASVAEPLPPLPSSEYDYDFTGADTFCDPCHDLGGNLHACLKETLNYAFETED